jgi:acyl-CoA thioester hydrolase
MSDWIETYRGIVYPWHCDHMGHMNVMWYTSKFDEACWQLLSMLGLTPSRFAKDGTRMAAVEQHTQYKLELHAGDAVSIRSVVLEIKEKSLRMVHEMRHDVSGEIAATTEVVGVQIDASAGRAKAIPEDVRRKAVGVRGREFGVILETL